MAIKTLYLTNTVTDNWQILSESSPGTDAVTSPVVGWIVAKTAATNYSSFDSGVERVASGNWSATAQPDGTLDNTLGDAFRAGPFNGSFANTNWTVQLAVQSTTAVTAASAIGLRFRLFKSANADGSGATELTGGVVLVPASGYYSLTPTGTGVTNSNTWAPGGTVALTNEYLFVQIGCYINTASGSNGSDVNFRIGDTATIITTPDFTASDVTVNGTGVTSTAAVGIASVGIEKSSAGNSLSGSVESLTISGTKALIGNSGSGTVGTIIANSAKTLTGSSSSGNVGNIERYLSEVLTGNTASGTVGSSSISRSVNNTGVTGLGTIGSVTSSISKAIIGNSANASISNLSDSEGIIGIITGNSSVLTPGSVEKTASKALTGSSGTVNAGSVGKTASKALTGNSGTAAIGTIGFLDQGNIQWITGVTGTATVGSVTKDITKGITGNSVTAILSSLSDSEGLSKPITGNSAVATPGSIYAAIPIALTGTTGTGSAGSMIATSYSVAFISGVTIDLVVGNVIGIDDYFTVASNVQKINPSAVIELFELDATNILGGGIYRFHSGVNELGNDIVWQGQTYVRFPIEVEGLEVSGNNTGPPARPTIKVSNYDGLMGAEVRTLGDLLTSKLIRRRTFARYLDAENFVAGNPIADPDVHFPDEIWFVDRKSKENAVFIEFELASALDIAGVMIPHRQCIQNTCTWRYKSPECGWIPVAYYTKGDVPTSVDNDSCGKRLSSCKVRFGQYAQLPYGGFPGVGLF